MFLPLLTLAAMQAQETPPSDPVGTVLKASGLSHKDTGNFYTITYANADTKRNQVVYLRKKGETYNSLSVQEAFSLCYDKPDAPGTEQLRNLFQRRFAVGGLVLEAPSANQKNWRIRFRIEVPSTCSVERLKTYLQLVQGTTDPLEKELNPNEEDRL